MPASREALPRTCIPSFVALLRVVGVGLMADDLKMLEIMLVADRYCSGGKGTVWLILVLYECVSIYGCLPEVI